MVNQQNSRFDSKRLIENREVRIFLSSTFSDMQQERTALLKTFDTLKIVANRRNITLSVVDLRWGVTEEESRSGKVLSVCFEEIENSHPFFIGILGSRYGTSPDLSELKKNPDLKDRYPWIVEDIVNKLSITEMEMQYGVLRNDNDVEAFFIIKNTPDTLPDDEDRLTRLKNKILNQSRFPTGYYNSLEDLCEKVETAVLAIIDKRFPKKENTRLERERTIQKAYIKSRYGHYQKSLADFERLDNFLSGDETHLVITGPSGMGKSALIANWLKEKEDTQQSHNIIYHFVGNSFSGSDHRQVLQHICDELYKLYSIKHYEGLNEKLEDEAQRILIEAGQKGKPVLIVIDGINQIADHDHSKLLNWLPQAPHTTKYLFSTLEEDETMKTFERLGYPVHLIGTLDRKLRREFITNYLHNVGKKLADEKMDRILDAPVTENMLVLKTLLDELICFGSYEQLDNRIDFYLSASSISDFFDRMLQRMEEDYKDVPRILSLIALSENGLTEDELQAITRLRPLDIHIFYCAFYNHMVTREGLVTFSHQYVTDAVWQRYGLGNPETARPYRLQIIDHISINNIITRNRKISELAFQYYHIGNNEQLYKTILSFEAFRYFNASDQGDATLAQYWSKLLADDPEKYKLRNYLDLPFKGIPINRLPYPEIEFFVMTYFEDNKTALMYSQTFLYMTVDRGKEDSITMAAAYNNIGVVYENQYDYPKALEFFFKALEINVRILEFDHPSTAMLYFNIGGVYHKQRDFPKALEYNFKALEIREKILGSDHPETAMSINEIGDTYYDMGDTLKALEYNYKALEIREKVLDPDHPLIGRSYCDIGFVYGRLRDYSKAHECFLKALEISMKVLGTDHPSIGSSYNNIGLVYDNQGDYLKALEYYFKALAIYERTLDQDHPFIATSYSNINGVFDHLGECPADLEHFFKALEICENILGQDHPLTAMSYNSIGSVYYDEGDNPKALEYHFKALDINEKVLGINHPSTATTYSNIGTVCYDQGDYAKALEYYFKALDINEKVLGINHPSTATTYSNIGTVFYDQGDYTKALEYYFKALEIRERVLDPDHSSTATNYNNIGLVYNQQGDYANALEYFLKALKIREKILGSDNPKTLATRDHIDDVREKMDGGK